MSPEMMMAIGVFMIIISMMVFTIFTGDAKSHEKGLLGKLNSGLSCLTAPFRWGPIQAVFRLFLGRRLHSRIAAVHHYCCEQRNPIMPLFYLLMTVGGFSLFLITCSSLFPTAEGVWQIHYYVSIAYWLLCLYVYYVACTTDNGVVTADNAEVYCGVHKYDDILYFEKVCSTCNIKRPARSKHCSICNRCVSKLDHHCPWFNTCVAEKNFRWFVLFLYMHAVLCTYVSYLSLIVVYGNVKATGILDGVDRVKGVRMKQVPPTSYIIGFVISNFAIQVVFGITVFLIGLVLYVFGTFQLYHALINMTTIETFKWDELRDRRKEAARRKLCKQVADQYKAYAEKDMHPPFPAEYSTLRRLWSTFYYSLAFSKKKRLQRRFNAAVEAQASVLLQPIADEVDKTVVSTYSKGTWTNFWEMADPLICREERRLGRSVSPHISMGEVEGGDGEARETSGSGERRVGTGTLKREKVSGGRARKRR